MPRGGPVQDGEVEGGQVHAGVGWVGEVGELQELESVGGGDESAICGGVPDGEEEGFCDGRSGLVLYSASGVAVGIGDEQNGHNGRENQDTSHNVLI